MPEQSTLASTRQDVILVDERYHLLWISKADDLANQMNSTDYTVLQAHQPDARWFESNGLALPRPEQMAAFAKDGILFLPSWHHVQILSYDPKLFASIAFTACLNETVSRHAGRQVRLAQLGGSERELAEQRRLGTLVLAEFDTLEPESFAELCEKSFLGDPDTTSMHLRFNDLITNHRPIWLEQLRNVWTEERERVAKVAALEHLR